MPEVTFMQMISEPCKLFFALHFPMFMGTYACESKFYEFLGKL